MLARPRDRRGYPITFVTLVDKDGVPDFRTVDQERLAKCIRNRLCGMCGERLGKHIHFVGGPLCVENGLFIDPPMHRECAVYALKTCPHLASSKGRFAPVGNGHGLHVIEIASDEKAPWFALMHTTGYGLVQHISGTMLIKAARPWISVERWRDGEPMEAGA
jgi:hypothetical protein